MKLLRYALAALLLAPFSASARVVLPQFFTDSMVVQHSAVLTVPGTAKKNSTVKITPSWGDAMPIKVKADKQGNFTAKLQTPSTGGPYSITFTDGKEPLTLNDVWSGEVWLCSGQSNMEMPVDGWGKVMDYRREVAEANSPMVRLLQVQKQTSYAPHTDANVNMGGWRSATPETVGNFSAIGYFFGRQLNDELGVPIGIIDCTWCGTPIESWCAYETLSGINEFGDELQQMADCGFDLSAALASYEAANKAWWEQVLPSETPDFDIATVQKGWDVMPVELQWEKTVLPHLNGIVWYQKTFSLPADAAGKPGQISIAAVDDRDVTYINGVEVGATNPANTRRLYDIPAGVLRAGDNVITVRVMDTGGEGGIWGDPNEMYVKVGDDKVSIAGMWNYKVAVDFSQFGPMPVSPMNPNFPTVLYNAMLHPMTVMPVRGVLWYQGCSNVGRDEQYSKAFKAMIEAWRADWDNPEMPFYFAQLAAFLQPKQLQPQSEWAALRQAQKDALALPYTGMAVTIDIGNMDDIHPKNKQEVARRFAIMALNNQYDRRQICEAPVLESCKYDGQYAILAFDRDVTLLGGGAGFIVKDANGKWGVGYGEQTAPNVIEVVSNDVANPVEVRYNWADYPLGDIRGETNLPVSPFTTAR